MSGVLFPGLKHNKGTLPYTPGTLKSTVTPLNFKNQVRLKDLGVIKSNGLIKGVAHDVRGTFSGPET